MFKKSKCFKRIWKGDRGFTLIELLVVIAIIGVLALIAMPRLVNRSDDAREKAVLSTLQSMRTVLDTYRAEYGKYPTETAIGQIMQDNGINWHKSGDPAGSGIKDPWDNNYGYDQMTDTTFIILSRGVNETKDDADDFYVTDVKTPLKGDAPETYSIGSCSDGGSW